MRTNYKYTIYSCYTGYIVQAVINNINPIFFIIYQKQLGISLEKIGLLIAVNFGVQILVDFLSARYVDRIGYRKSMVFAHIFSALGIMGVGILPQILPSAFAGLLLATICNGIGGGLLEVMVSPIVEAAPSGEKEKAMSILHSFYCWGCIAFIALSTITLHFIGNDRWYLIPVAWAPLPFINGFLFTVVPINRLVEDGERLPARQLFRKKSFWLFVLLMICAGASEMGMSQWASYFAETGLHISKTWGDLFGACFFCLLMGLSRAFYGKKGDKIDLYRFMCGSCILCIIGYLLAVFAPSAVIGLIGCGICGLSVGILWPGTFSQAAGDCREGGTAMFAFLALAGDIGCMSGPELVNLGSGLLPEIGLKAGLFLAIIFPVVMLFTMRCIIKDKNESR